MKGRTQKKTLAKHNERYQSIRDAQNKIEMQRNAEWDNCGELLKEWDETRVQLLELLKRRYQHDRNNTGAARYNTSTG